MNRQEIEEPEKSPQQAKRQNVLEKYGGAPLSFIMNNPKVTPGILLVLAATPIVITALVLAVVFLWQ